MSRGRRGDALLRAPLSAASSLQREILRKYKQRSSTLSVSARGGDLCSAVKGLPTARSHYLRGARCLSLPLQTGSREWSMYISGAIGESGSGGVLYGGANGSGDESLGRDSRIPIPGLLCSCEAKSAAQPRILSAQLSLTCHTSVPALCPPLHPCPAISVFLESTHGVVSKKNFCSTMNWKFK